VQGKEVLTSCFPRCKGGFTVPEQALAGGCAQDLGKSDGAMAPSPVLVDRCFIAQSADPGWRQFEWVHVYNPYRVKTICIAAFSVMENPTLLLVLLVSATHDSTSL
jgi:hypothetical protein